MTNDHHTSSSVALPEQLKELLHRYEAVCRKLEGLPGSAIQNVDAAVAEMKSEFDTLPELP
ncbi:MAG: hypothetical protein J6S90_05780, partial [Lentisphaeria bacterium]|nr:hypothetical protein [Lentisphaeria bacterium]